jgi:periplasmic protein CpxP/Spy
MKMPSILKTRRSPAVAGAAAVLVLGAATPVRAAWTAAAPGPAPDGRSLVLAQAPASPASNVETNIARLRQSLQITPAQEPQFNALADVMRQNARMMPSTPPPANPNAVDALRFAIQYGEQDLDGMKRLLPALQALYAHLSPAQQRTADQVFRQGPGE